MSEVARCDFHYRGFPQSVVPLPDSIVSGDMKAVRSLFSQVARVASVATLVCTSTFATSAFAGYAPESLAGKVYRESTFLSAVRSASERTIIFLRNGRYIYLKSAGGSAFILQAPYKNYLSAPPSDGTYTYERRDENMAIITLRGDDGRTETMERTFQAPGTDSYTSFVVSDLADLQQAAALNLSMRVRVEPGRPSIVGFVVPGDPAPVSGNTAVPVFGFRQREVLIRAVGPSLAPLGVSGTWADPDFQLFRAGARHDPEAHYADWSVAGPGDVLPGSVFNAGTAPAFRKIFDYVGAFPLLPGSKDAAAVLRLNPGDYTIVCDPPAGDAGGEVLIEVYFLP